MWAWETVPLHHSYFCVSSAYKQKRPKIFCVRSKQQNECTLNRCEVIYGTEGINDIKRPLCVALLADDVNNKTATCFFSCRSSLFDAGRPLSLSPSAIVCPSEFTLDSLPLVLTHTHIIPSSGLCLTPAWNQFQSLHPPTPALAPILSHHEARLLLCQPENNPHHHHHLNAPFLSQNPSVLYPRTTGLASVLIITRCSK